MAPQAAAPASTAARPLQHALVAPAAPSAQPLKATGRSSSSRAAALRWPGLTLSPPPPFGRRLEDAAALVGAAGFPAAPGGLGACLQHHTSGAAARGASRRPAAVPAAVRQRRRQRLVWAAGLAGPGAADTVAAHETAAVVAGAASDASEQQAAATAAGSSAAAASAAAAGSAAGPGSPRALPRRRQPGRLSAEHEQELAHAVAAGGPGAAGAAAELAAANVALVHHLARRFDGRGLPREDVVGEGLGALQRAAQRYRPGTEARFATFATPVIWQAMQKAVHGQSRSVRLPAHHHTDMRRVRAASEELAAELGHTPGLEAVADRCGLSVEYTAHLVKQMKQGEGRARLPPLTTPNSRAAAAEPLGPDDESDDALEAEERRAHEEAVQREVEALLAKLAQESEKLALVVRLRHRLGEADAGEVGGTDRLRPFKEVGTLIQCTGAHASALYKKARIRMESLSRRAAGRQASQPGSRHNLQQQLETACKDGRLAAAVARLSEERQLLLALRCGWLHAPWLAGRGRPTFKSLGLLWERSACWASNNCTGGAKELRQMVLPLAEENYNLLHALEGEQLQPHFPAQMLQRWEQLTRELPGSRPPPAGPAQHAQQAPSTAQQAPSMAQWAVPAADAPAMPAGAASATPRSSTATIVPRPAMRDAGASSVVPFRLRQEAQPPMDEPQDLHARMTQLSQHQSRFALAGAR